MIALVNPTVKIGSKFKIYNFHLYINSKILLYVVLYNNFFQIEDLISTLGPLGINGNSSINMDLAARNIQYY
jgi:hypothetical protein